MNILLIQNDLEWQQQLHFVLESSFSCCVASITSASSLNLTDASIILFDLLIYDIKGSVPEEIENFFKQNKNTPVILCAEGNTGYSSNPNVVKTLERSSMADTLTHVINTLINNKTLKKPSPDRIYCRIRTGLLLSVTPLRADVFIRLSETKYVKLFQEGDHFDRSDMEKYAIRKGIEYLYLKTNQTKEFTEKLLADLRTLWASKDLSFEAANRRALSVHEIVRELGNRLGFGKEVQELVKTQVLVTVKGMAKNPKLSAMLAKLHEHKDEYISAHSTLCAHLACSIASQIQWASQTTFHKLTLASFLHDITLNNQELAAIQTLEELDSKKATLSKKDIEEYKDHPVKAASISKQFSEVPPDVDTILIQHHEQSDGSGFPRKLSHMHIAPLSVVFIIAHDLADYMLTNRDDFKIDEFISKKKEIYHGSQFKKLLGVLKGLQ